MCVLNFIGEHDDEEWLLRLACIFSCAASSVFAAVSPGDRLRRLLYGATGAARDGRGLSWHRLAQRMFGLHVTGWLQSFPELLLDFA